LNNNSDTEAVSRYTAKQSIENRVLEESTRTVKLTKRRTFSGFKGTMKDYENEENVTKIFVRRNTGPIERNGVHCEADDCGKGHMNGGFEHELEEEKLEDEKDETTTVNINVGGTLFEVS